MVNRCGWCSKDPVYERYHDEVWGRVETRDSVLFEMLVLESFQSGLSWITILRKQAAFQAAFDQFDMEKVAAYGPEEEARLLQDAGIVRNKGKITAAIHNAKACLAIRAEFGDLYSFFRQFAPLNRAVPPGGYTLSELPLITEEAKEMAKALKKRGFRFTGPMTCQSFMQAVGLLNDHVKGCFLCIY